MMNGIDEMLNELENNKPRKEWKCIDKGMCVYVPGLDGEWFKEVWTTPMSIDGDVAEMYLNAYVRFKRSHNMSTIKNVKKGDNAYPCYLELCVKDGLVVATYYYTYKDEFMVELCREVARN